MKALITSQDTPPPAGPYSAGLKVGEWIYLSGQGGFDPETGSLISDDIEGQTEQTFQNISSLLRAAGVSLDEVVSCLVHLADLSLVSRFNASYERQFAVPRPVRTTVGAELLAGMLVEVTVIAHQPAAT